MKKFFIIGILVFCCHYSKAQDLRIGFHVGGNLSRYTGGKQYTIYDKSSKVGYEIGADIQYLVKNKFNIASGVNLLQTGGKFSVMSGYAGSFGGSQTEFPEINTKALSIEIPLKIGCYISFKDGLALAPTVGFYGRYALASLKDKVSIASDKNRYDWDCYKDFNNDMYHIDAMKKFEYGVILGVSAKIATHYVLSLNYRRGLNSLSSQYDIKKSDISCSIGYIW